MQSTSFPAEPTAKQPSGTEGKVAKAIEAQTSKAPSDLFLWSALGAVVGSASLQIAGKKELSNFIGQWVPTILILGLYNKLVKVAGSERREQTSSSEHKSSKSAA